MPALAEEKTQTDGSKAATQPAASQATTTQPSKPTSGLPGILQDHIDSRASVEVGTRSRMEGMYGPEVVSRAYDTIPVDDKFTKNKNTDPQVQSILDKNYDKIESAVKAAPLESYKIDFKSGQHSNLQTVEIPFGTEKFIISRQSNLCDDGTYDKVYTVNHQPDVGRTPVKLDTKSKFVQMLIAQAEQRIFTPAETMKTEQAAFLDKLLRNPEKIGKATWKPIDQLGPGLTKFEADIDGYHVVLAKLERQVAGESHASYGAVIIGSRYSNVDKSEERALSATWFPKKVEGSTDVDTIATAFNAASATLSKQGK